MPLLLIWEPSWGWVVAANILLGINPMGLNEAAGYGAVAITAWLAGYLAANYGLRPAPFLLGLSYALIGPGVSGAFVRETRPYARLEASRHPVTDVAEAHLSNGERLWRDSGYAVGAAVGGVAADLWGLRAAVLAAAVITVISAGAVAVRMHETHSRG